MSDSPVITVFFPQEGEQWSAFLRRVEEAEGERLLVLSSWEDQLCAAAGQLSAFLSRCKKMEGVRLATKHPRVVRAARQEGIGVIESTAALKLYMPDHPKLADVLRVFSPHLWRQQVTSRLQRMGFLSMPRLRIGALLCFSLLLFLFVVLRLLPSADVTVRPRRETVMQTANIFLVQSGATVALSERVRTLALLPITVRIKRELSFDHVSREFIGTPASVTLTLTNESDERYGLKEGTRFENEAGMVFRSTDAVAVEAGGTAQVRAQADPYDRYGVAVGERGNLPAGLTWKIPGLPLSEQKLVYAENAVPAVGGTTAYRTVLHRNDLETANKRFEQEMLTLAGAEVEERVALLNARDDDATWTLLQYDELKKTAFSGVVLPFHLVGQSLSSVPVSGEIVHTVYAYDARAIMDLLRQDLQAHVREGKTLTSDPSDLSHLVSHVIQYDDALSWVKLTADLTGTEQYLLDPHSTEGAMFAMDVRKRIAGLPVSEALRILHNLPEVESARISLWPPWKRMLPDIPSHISLSTEE